MRKTQITSTTLLLTGALLLGGCAERGSSSAPGAGIDSSLTSSQNSVSDVSCESSSSSNSTSSTDISVNSSSTESSSEQSSDVSAAPVP